MFQGKKGRRKQDALTPKKKGADQQESSSLLPGFSINSAPSFKGKKNKTAFEEIRDLINNPEVRTREEELVQLSHASDLINAYFVSKGGKINGKKALELQSADRAIKTRSRKIESEIKVEKQRQAELEQQQALERQQALELERQRLRQQELPGELTTLTRTTELIESRRDPEKKVQLYRNILSNIAQRDALNAELETLKQQTQQKLDAMPKSTPFPTNDSESHVGGGYIGIAPTISEGWKLHISATAYSAQQVFDATIGIIRGYKIPFKYKGNAHENPANQGRKFIAIYPTSKLQAKELANALDVALSAAGLEQFHLENEVAIGDSGRVYARYGSFTAENLLNANGSRKEFDDRSQIKPDHIPAWATEGSHENEFSRYNIQHLDQGIIRQASIALE